MWVAEIPEISNCWLFSVGWNDGQHRKGLAQLIAFSSTPSLGYQPTSRKNSGCSANLVFFLAFQANFIKSRAHSQTPGVRVSALVIRPYP